MQNETWGIVTTEALVKWLTEIEIKNTGSYVDAYSELVDFLENDASNITDNESMLRYFQTVVDAMRAWIQTYEEIV
jgi:hypothetical protein